MKLLFKVFALFNHEFWIKCPEHGDFDFREENDGCPDCGYMPDYLKKKT